MSDFTKQHWTADSILEFLQANFDELKAMGVTKIGLFGSYVRGEQAPDSDIDFLFSMPNMTWTSWMDVWNFLETELGTRVDLVPEKDLRPELQPTVMAEVRYVSE